MRRAFVVALALVLVLAGCGGDDDPEPPARFDDAVPEAAAAVASITVQAGGRTAEAPADLLARSAPLLAGRVFDAPEPAASYGLDAPRATLVYRLTSGGERVLRVGAENFDRRSFYVRRDGDVRVFLVPADQLRPLLALVGV